MLPVSAQELASIRADVADAACDLPCVIWRSTRTPDAQGGASQTWAAISAPKLKAGMAQPTAGQLSNYGYLIGSLAAWQVQLPYGTDVKHGDRLVIAGQTLTVQVDLSPQSYDALQTVIATEVK